jgi:hypothetical protein
MRVPGYRIGFGLVAIPKRRVGAGMLYYETNM